MDNPTWIPVTKETLPPIGERVLIWLADREKYLLAHLEAEHGYLLRWMLSSGMYIDDAWYPCYLNSPNSPKQWITHWLPLNLPPSP